VQLDRPLQVITPTVDGDVLTALARPDAAFTGRGLHRVMGRHSADGVRRALERLAGQGIVDVAVVGPSKLYSLNRDHLAAPYIAGLTTLREQLVDRLRQRFAAWYAPSAYAALFGSAVGGQMRADSDVDVFVVRPDETAPGDGGWASQLAELAHDGSRWTGNDLRIFEMSVAEARVGRVKDKHVLQDVSEHGICVAGPEDFLRARPARRARRG
jgi:hypothetical protein